MTKHSPKYCSWYINFIIMARKSKKWFYHQPFNATLSTTQPFSPSSAWCSILHMSHLICEIVSGSHIQMYLSVKRCLFQPYKIWYFHYVYLAHKTLSQLDIIWVYILNDFVVKNAIFCEFKIIFGWNIKWKITSFLCNMFGIICLYFLINFYLYVVIRNTFNQVFKIIFVGYRSVFITLQ